MLSNVPKLSVMLLCDPRCAKLAAAYSVLIETMLDRRHSSNDRSDSSNKGSVRTIETQHQEESNINAFLEQQLPSSQ